MNEVKFPVIRPLNIPPEAPKVNDRKINTPSVPFDGILSKEIGKADVKLSAHARMRLKERGLELTEGDISRIRGAIDVLAAKGGRDSLVLMGDTALIVNVPNRTVVTAMDTGNVYTNIDSAVVVNHRM